MRSTSKSISFNCSALIGAWRRTAQNRMWRGPGGWKGERATIGVYSRAHARVHAWRVATGGTRVYSYASAGAPARTSSGALNANSREHARSFDRARERVETHAHRLAHARPDATTQALAHKHDQRRCSVSRLPR
eukprot:1794241-Pleurochrysis_carterae.AAC.1